jgi:predicted DNA-binding transcriptional regulator AlpA
VSTASPKPKYIRVAPLRARYGGVSDMWIARKTRDFGFPAPVYLGGRDRFWRLDELEQWDRAMIERGATLCGIVAKRSA